MKKIVIIGTCGSGKTTLGRHLAKNLDCPVTDLDDLFWLPNWTIRHSDEFAALIEKATHRDCWIIPTLKPLENERFDMLDLSFLKAVGS